MKEKEPYWAQFLLKLPSELTDRIAEKALELNISKTALIRLAVTMFLDGLEIKPTTITNVVKGKPTKSTRRK